MDQTSISDKSLLYKICQDYFRQGGLKVKYVPVAEHDFLQLIPHLPENEIILISLFCVEEFNNIPGFTLLYVLEKRGCQNIVLLQRSLPGKEATSVAQCFPSACWFEREIRDGFGIEFYDAFDKRRLFLHEVYPQSFHPLLKSFKNCDITQARKALVPGELYVFKEITGNGVYQIPVGPVHAGIIEPGHFRFNVIGETIFSLEIRMFYKHRGIEKLAEGKTAEQCLVIAETISGDESASNAAAFCMALESISGTMVPERASFLRTIVLEMERIYSHLGDMGGMIVDVAFPLGACEFAILREEILRQNSVLTGSRFLKGMLCPGGVKRDTSPETLSGLSDYLKGFADAFNRAVNYIHNTNSVIDRLETTGVINKELVSALNITGPAARAAGIGIDNRIDHPYGIYSSLELMKRMTDKGDVLNRFDVKAAEVIDSVNIIQKLIADIPHGDIMADFKTRDGYALALVEAARGQNLNWVYVKNGLIERYKVRTASFCNWQAIEQAVIGNIVPDFPLINKSLNLSYAGTDL